MSSQGDGIVPYLSLSFPQVYWKTEIPEISVIELPAVNHEDSINTLQLISTVLRVVCAKETPKPRELRESPKKEAVEVQKVPTTKLSEAPVESSMSCDTCTCEQEQKRKRGISFSGLQLPLTTDDIKSTRKRTSSLTQQQQQQEQQQQQQQQSPQETSQHHPQNPPFSSPTQPNSSLKRRHSVSPRTSKPSVTQSSPRGSDKSSPWGSDKTFPNMSVPKEPTTTTTTMTTVITTTATTTKVTEGGT